MGTLTRLYIKQILGLWSPIHQIKLRLPSPHLEENQNSHLEPKAIWLRKTTYLLDPYCYCDRSSYSAFIMDPGTRFHCLNLYLDDLT
ncbi:hypothetical protein LguiA_029140 [Lonicera macranthoides]